MPMNAEPTTPATPARKAPSAKTAILRTGTLMPRASVISALSTAARTMAPARVFSWNHHRTTKRTPAAPIMNSRRIGKVKPASFTLWAKDAGPRRWEGAPPQTRPAGADSGADAERASHKIQRAVSDVDDLHHTEDQREAAAQEEQERGVGDVV